MHDDMLPNEQAIPAEFVEPWLAAVIRTFSLDRRELVAIIKQLSQLEEHRKFRPIIIEGLPIEHLDYLF